MHCILSGCFYDPCCPYRAYIRQFIFITGIIFKRNGCATFFLQNLIFDLSTKYSTKKNIFFISKGLANVISIIDINYFIYLCFKVENNS